MKKSKVFSVLRRGVAGVLVVFLLVFLPTLGLRSDENLTLIYNAFVGAKSKYQGMIEIWNIDTFESGTVSKISILNDYAKTFQKDNKGLYFIVRNVTETECGYMLASGQKPDMFSCSYGVASELADYVDVFSDSEIDLLSNFKNAGMNLNGELSGVAWCSGAYFLISTNQSLEKANVDTEKPVSLLDLSLSLGYEKENKNYKTTVYSLGYGCHKYIMPQVALSSYNDNGELSISDLSINLEESKQSSYSAYCNFIAGKSVVLLGTQRDVVRMKNREKLGKASDVIFEPLTKFTDLVQFMFLTKCEDKTKREYMEKFVRFVLEKNQQTKLLEKSLFPVTSIDKNGLNLSVMQDIILENIESFRVFNVLMSKDEIERLQSDSIKK